ncbi:MAG: hypothetical protein VKN72_19180 [Nostocales cyanobacterium 94392]|nr:hypothetical protein [Nostocales cyanobacterium 94392]
MTLLNKNCKKDAHSQVFILPLCSNKQAKFWVGYDGDRHFLMTIKGRRSAPRRE